MFLLQLAQFGRLQVQGIQLLHLVGQQLHAAGVLVFGAGQQLDLAPLAQPVGGVLLHCAGQGPVIGVGVEQVALG